MVNNTSFTFGIVEDAEVTIEVHNVAGQLIKTLISGNYEAGEYTVKWNGADNSGRPVKQGVYYYTLKAGNFVDSKKLIIVNLED
jgi:flagellar hook assembly protein FlgD